MILRWSSGRSIGWFLSFWSSSKSFSRCWLRSRSSSRHCDCSGCFSGTRSWPSRFVSIAQSRAARPQEFIDSIHSALNALQLIVLHMFAVHRAIETGLIRCILQLLLRLNLEAFPAFTSSQWCGFSQLTWLFIKFCSWISIVGLLLSLLRLLCGVGWSHHTFIDSRSDFWHVLHALLVRNFVTRVESLMLLHIYLIWSNSISI